MKKIVFRSFRVLSMLFMYSISCFIQAEPQQEFVIAQPSTQSKKLSKDSLKESIGQATRDLFEASTKIGNQLGSLQINVSGLLALQQDQLAVLKISSGVHKNAGALQIELAQIQKKCSAVIEKLVDNQPPFKKAGRAELESSLAAVKRSEADLVVYTQELVHLQQHVKNVPSDAKQKNKSGVDCMQKVSNILSVQAESIKKTNQKLEQTACLKNL